MIAEIIEIKSVTQLNEVSSTIHVCVGHRSGKLTIHEIKNMYNRERQISTTVNLMVSGYFEDSSITALENITTDEDRATASQFLAVGLSRRSKHSQCKYTFADIKVLQKSKVFQCEEDCRLDPHCIHPGHGKETIGIARTASHKINSNEGIVAIANGM